MSSWQKQGMALFRKDLRAELRTKTALSSVGVFTCSALFLIALATAAVSQAKTVSLSRLQDPTSLDAIREQMHLAWDSTGKMGLLWVVLCFAAFSGLSHSFSHEEDTGTSLALRLHTEPIAVLVGKLLFNFCVTLVVALIATPIYMVVTGMVVGAVAPFLILMLSGCVGLSSTATIVAALSAKARGTGSLYGALGLPLMITFIMLLINAARSIYIINVSTLTLVRDLGGLISYGVAMTAVSVLLFETIWEE